MTDIVKKMGKIKPGRRRKAARTLDSAEVTDKPEEIPTAADTDAPPAADTEGIASAADTEEIPSAAGTEDIPAADRPQDIPVADDLPVETTTTHASGSKSKKTKKSYRLQTEEEESQVLEWIEEHPCLLNMKNKDYKNKAKKERLWDDKANEMNCYGKCY